MEGAFSLELGNTALWILTALCCVAYFALTRNKRSNVPGPVGLPLLGYLPFLGKDPHLSLYRLSQKYGKIFSLYMARKYVVVVTDFEMAKELFSKPATLDRPPDFFPFFPGGFGLGNACGPEWVEQRRYTIKEIKDLGLTGSTFEKLVESEVADYMTILEQAKGEPTDFYIPLSTSVSNNVLTSITGHRLPMNDPQRQILEDGLKAFSAIYNPSCIINFFPSLYYLGLKLGIVRDQHWMKDLENMNQYLKNVVNNSKTEESHSSYICSYLKEIENKQNSVSRHWFNDKNLVGNVQALIMAGSDTTWVSLQWLLFSMATFPDIQAKVHRELDAVFSEGQIACWNDRRDLPYCTAVLYEAQRWRTVVPINIIHRTSQNVEIRGFNIPKDTDLLALIWAFHNDKNYWKDPEKFSPERFLSNDGKTNKMPDNFAPFFMGKRRCPGETVALIQLFMYFTSILHRFRITTAKEGIPLDLGGTVATVYRPKSQPLRFLARNR